MSSSHNTLLTNKNSKSFTSRMFYRFLLPSCLSSLALSIGNMVDALVIGTRMGEEGLAALSIVLPVYMVFNVFDIGIAVGGSIEFSRLLGAGQAQRAKAHFNRMLQAALAVSLLFALLGNVFLEQLLFLLGTEPSQGATYEMAYAYTRILVSAAPVFFLNFLLYYFVRSDDNQKLAAAGFVVGNVLDVVLNYVFVIVCDYGVRGAIFSTVIGLSVGNLIFLPHLFLKYNILGLQWVRPDWREVYNSYKNGFSSSNQYVFQFFFILLANYLLLRMSGTAGVAVFDLVLNISYIGLSFFDAAQSTLQPLVSTFLGERNREASRETARLSFLWGFALSLCLLSAIFFFAPRIVLLFGLGNVLALGTTAVRVYCVGAVFAGLSIILAAYFQAQEKSMLSFIIVLLRNFIVLLPATFLFGYLGNVNSFWYVFPATELASVLIWLSLLGLLRPGHKAGEEAGEAIFSRTIANRNEDISLLIRETEAFCEERDADARQTYYVSMAVEEVCSAIMRSAFTGDGDEYIQLTLIAEPNGCFELHIRDNAGNFNPFDMKTRRACMDDDENSLESIGILMVKSKAKSFFYRRYQGFNTLTVTV